MSKKISTRQIGDGKLPNKYWVSVHEDFLYLNGDCWDWDSDRSNSKPQVKTLAVFSSYEKAMCYFNDIMLGEEIEGIVVRGKTIEDRLSGELADETYHEVKKLESLFHEDVQFTKDKMKSLGVSFA